MRASTLFLNLIKLQILPFAKLMSAFCTTEIVSGLSGSASGFVKTFSVVSNPSYGQIVKRAHQLDGKIDEIFATSRRRFRRTDGRTDALFSD